MFAGLFSEVHLPYDILSFFLPEWLWSCRNDYLFRYVAERLRL